MGIRCSFEFVDGVFENINYYAVEASTQIAKEKGSYRLFEGSDWQTGAYFESVVITRNVGVN